ncbi:MAG: SPOR domain-containing protein [Desulfatibacillum sp.]|nr:SPOR domain-containing protein [Desulfatibacillum sp.]
MNRFSSGDGITPDKTLAWQTGFRFFFLFAASLFLFAILESCSSHLTEVPGNFSTRASRACPPKSVALLPFENLTECPGIAKLVRESLYSHLSPKLFEDVELTEVDSRLEAVGAASYEDMKNVDVQELGRLLHADSVVYGSVTKCSKVFIGIFSQVCVATSLEVYDTRTGEKVWEDFQEACFNDGGVPLDLLSIPLTAMRSGMNMRDVVRVRVVDDMCRTLVARVPSPGETIHPGDSPAPLPDSRDTFELQVGAFQEQDGAVETLVSMQDKGFPAFMRKDEEQGKVWYRILLGPFERRTDAESTLDNVRANAAPDAFIRVFHNP